MFECRSRVAGGSSQVVQGRGGSSEGRPTVVRGSSKGHLRIVRRSSKGVRGTLRRDLARTLRLIFRYVLREVLRDLAQLIFRWLIFSIKYSIRPIDLVIVNLYPFEQTVAIHAYARTRARAHARTGARAYARTRVRAYEYLWSTSQFTKTMRNVSNASEFIRTHPGISKRTQIGPKRSEHVPKPPKLAKTYKNRTFRKNV